jgi:hypothetical protein
MRHSERMGLRRNGKTQIAVLCDMRLRMASPIARRSVAHVDNFCISRAALTCSITTAVVATGLSSCWQHRTMKMPDLLLINEALRDRSRPREVLPPKQVCCKGVTR